MTYIYQIFATKLVTLKKCHPKCTRLSCALHCGYIIKLSCKWRQQYTMRLNKVTWVDFFHVYLFIYLFGGLRRFQHCTGHITTGSWKGRGNRYIQFVRVLYCKLPTNSKQVPAFPLQAMTGMEPRPQRWEARVLPFCHRGPFHVYWNVMPII